MSMTFSGFDCSASLVLDLFTRPFENSGGITEVGELVQIPKKKKCSQQELSFTLDLNV